MPNLSGNRGEWSEIYVFLKLLADGKLFAADADLNRIPNLFYPLVAIVRNEAVGGRTYYRNGTVKVVVESTGETIVEIAVDEFVAAAAILLDRIKASSSTFDSQVTEDFLALLDVRCLKAPSPEKRDITLVVHDSHTNSTPSLGFSIKSNLGSASTLLNPGKTTNFIFQVLGNQIPVEEVARINAIDSTSKIRDRLTAILENGCQLKYADMESRNFRLNLQMIDSSMPDMVAQMLLLFYDGHASTVKGLVELLDVQNPLGFDLGLQHPLYDYKIKGLLTDIALGMTPAKKWSGKIDATGGYIIVKANGELVCYHIYNRNEFQAYLLDHTKLDTASSTRYDFATIYSDGSNQFIKLNLQIRFT